MSANQDFIIKEDKVFIPSNKWWNEERFIAELKEANQQYTIDSMIERFKEIEEKFKDLKTEFDTSDDKIKLAGKISRTKNYICHAKAIGNYEPILTAIDAMEETIKENVIDTLKQKEALCKEAETLLNPSDWKLATEKLRDLQKAFKALPIVPDLKNEELKATFEKIQDDFFKQKQANFESYEQTLLDNLSKKLELCEQAEALKDSSDWKKTTESIQALNENWKQIGHVPKHRNDELWLRFNTAKDHFFNRKRENFEEIKVEHEKNLEVKIALCEKAEALKDSTDWKKTSEAFNALMEEWKQSGRVSNEKSNEIWERFRAAQKYFFDKKDAHYSDIRIKLEDNHARKMAIVQHAETLKNSNDFEGATQEFMDMMDEWKTIGRVPKEYGDEAWERFIKAKKDFFDRKDQNRAELRKTLAKDIEERLQRNKKFYNKIRRELEQEQELLFDLDDRINNLPATLRSYEKREQYLQTKEDVEEKINSLKEKVKEIKEKIDKDEKEIRYIIRGPQRKKTNDKEQVESGTSDIVHEEKEKTVSDEIKETNETPNADNSTTSDTNTTSDNTETN
ncbi:MAG: DUF349 domain-containing protein [Chitinophagaceae bacterium]